MDIHSCDSECWAHLTASRIDFPFSWVGHTPFAMWLVCKLRPEIFVELGTHSGNSYFAFCESVAFHHLSTRCFAVDTWQGDKHAERYDNSVFEAVSTHNCEQYNAFSRLLRMTFDEALDHFEPYSIDLLHIDGLHTYDAVKHDFETWLDKMSPTGVILFHDIAVRDRDFGVFKLWAEIKRNYEFTVEFSHSHGLGVLFLQRPTDNELLSLIEGDSDLLFRFESLGMTRAFTVASESHSLLRDQISKQNDELRDLLTHQHSQNLLVADLTTQNAQLHNENEQLRLSNLQLAQRVQSLEASLAEIFSSTSWRITAPVRMSGRLLRQSVAGIRHYKTRAKNGTAFLRQHGFLAFVRHASKKIRSYSTQTPPINLPPDINYADWFAADMQMRHQAVAQWRSQVIDIKEPILFSIIMPVYNSDLNFLQEAINSVRQQIYPHWELCICNDASSHTEIRPFLDQLSQHDARIKVCHAENNLHISGASNMAIEMAQGAFLILLDHDDVLTDDALFWVAKVIHSHPEALLIYSDEDKIGQDGVFCQPYFKSDWDIERLIGQNFFSHLGIFSHELVRKVGGFQTGLEGSQDYDLLLRCLLEMSDAEQKSCIFHIPKVLYHWRILPGSTALDFDEKPYVRDAALQALNHFVSRSGWHGKVEAHPERADFYRFVAHLPEQLPSVTIIIPTFNGLGYLKPCVDSVLNLTRYKNYSILIIDNRSDDPETLLYLDQVATLSNVSVIKDDQPFNYSALNNRAVSLCDSEFVLLLNNDTKVIHPDWLCEMVAAALRPDAGAVGAKLLYANNCIQHGGVIMGLGGIAGHAHHMMPDSEFGYFGLAKITQQVSAVTAACLLIRRSIYISVGGLNEVDLTVAFNDVDFCLKVMQAGYRNIWTPFAKLYHYESVTRGNDLSGDNHKYARFLSEIAYMQKTWPDIIKEDPFYNINLNLTHSYYLRPINEIRLGRLLENS